MNTKYAKIRRNRGNPTGKSQSIYIGIIRGENLEITKIIDKYKITIFKVGQIMPLPNIKENSKSEDTLYLLTEEEYFFEMI